PVDLRHPVAGLPVAQPDEVEAAAVKQAAVLADGELAHPPHDQQLDLGELREVDERLDVLLASPHPSTSICHEGTKTRRLSCTRNFLRAFVASWQIRAAAIMESPPGRSRRRSRCRW